MFSRSAMANSSYMHHYGDDHFHGDEECEDYDDMSMFQNDGVDAERAELEAMLYSQIYFEQHEEVQPDTAQMPKITVMELPVSGGDALDSGTDADPHDWLKTKSPVASMLNYSGRAFMLQPAKELKTYGKRRKDKNTNTKKEELNTPASKSDTTSETVEKTQKKKKKLKKSKHTVVVLSDSDFEIEKNHEKENKKGLDKEKKAKKRRLDVEDEDTKVNKNKKNKKKKEKKKEKQPAKKRKLDENIICVNSSDSEKDVIVLDDSGVLADTGDISLNLTGRAVDNIEDLNTGKSEDLKDIDLQKWDGSPPLTIKQVQQLLKPCDWTISNDDRYGVTNSRYYNQRAVECRNCKQSGHRVRDCRKPKKIVCIHCGESGHKTWSCPRSLCYNCDLPGHRLRECQRPKKSYDSTCKRCNMYGHAKHECREIWRQYHVTTTLDGLTEVKEEENRQPYCYNCGRKGHFGHECNRRGYDDYWIPSTPLISYYEVPKEIRAEKRKSYEASEDHFEKPKKFSPSKTSEKKSSTSWFKKVKDGVDKTFRIKKAKQKAKQKAKPIIEEEILIVDSSDDHHKDRKKKRRERQREKKYKQRESRVEKNIRRKETSNKCKANVPGTIFDRPNVPGTIFNKPGAITIKPIVGGKRFDKPTAQKTIFDSPPSNWSPRKNNVNKKNNDKNKVNTGNISTKKPRKSKKGFVISF